MKCVVVLAYSRPDYLVMTLDKLNLCHNSNDWNIIIHIDRATDGSINNKVEQISYDFIEKSTFRTTRIIRSEKNNGCWKSKKIALNEAFKTNDFCVLLEDDIILARDSLLFFEHATKLSLKHHDLSIICAHSHLLESPEAKINDNILKDLWVRLNNNETCWGSLILTRWANPWGWGISKNHWKNIKEEWIGYDAQLSQILMNKNGFVIQALISRATHIGIKTSRDLNLHINTTQKERIFHYLTSDDRDNIRYETPPDDISAWFKKTNELWAYLSIKRTIKAIWITDTEVDETVLKFKKRFPEVLLREFNIRHKCDKDSNSNGCLACEKIFYFFTDIIVCNIHDNKYTDIINNHIINSPTPGIRKVIFISDEIDELSDRWFD